MKNFSLDTYAQYFIISTTNLHKTMYAPIIQHVPKGMILSKPGQIYLVKKGVVREFITLNSGDEVTTQMIPEKEYFFCSSKSTRQKYQVLEASILQRMENPGPRELTSILEETLCRMELRAELLKLKKPGERLETFEKQYPNICNRVPHYHVASLLNITPQTLSRIRRIRALRRRPPS
jgi:hypothetical protein